MGAKERKTRDREEREGQKREGEVELAGAAEERRGGGKGEHVEGGRRGGVEEVERGERDRERRSGSAEGVCNYGGGGEER